MTEPTPKPPHRGWWRRLNEWGPGYLDMYPELRRYEDQQELRDAIHDCHQAIMQRRSFWLFVGIGVLFGMSLGFWQALIGDRVLGRFGVPPLVGMLIVLVGGGLLGIFGYIVAYFRPMRDLFRARLNEDGHPTCLSCGYNLRAAVETRCPECAAPIPEPKTTKTA